MDTERVYVCWPAKDRAEAVVFTASMTAEEKVEWCQKAHIDTDLLETCRRQELGEQASKK
ncbi:hypothetical protein [Paraburkholderia youngii]|uniref:hypothetical protein n=1 Tax=Paraburkholderia youngii TaxID=2782701 RepID=UPI003D2140C7